MRSHRRGEHSRAARLEKQEEERVNKMRRELGGKVSLWVYVGNIPLNWGQQQTQDFFGQCAQILAVRIKTRPNSRTGTAHVCFASMTQAEATIHRCQGYTLPDCCWPLLLKWVDTEQNRLGIGEREDHKLFVGSLPRQATDEDLFQVFSMVGQVKSVRIEKKSWWAFVEFTHKESAILAVKQLDEQVFLHGSHIPIDVRFKERKYNSFMTKKHQKQEIDPFLQIDVDYYREVNIEEGRVGYMHIQTEVVQAEPPPPGTKVYPLHGGKPYVQTQTGDINDATNRKDMGPVGANLFIFNLPLNLRESELANLFKQYGNILSVRIMTQPNGKSKGIGFVSYDSVQPANSAIEAMDGQIVRGRALKVEISKQDREAMMQNPTNLLQEFDL